MMWIFVKTAGVFCSGGVVGWRVADSDILSGYLVSQAKAGIDLMKKKPNSSGQ